MSEEDLSPQGLARRAVEVYVTGRRVIDVPDELPELLGQRAGAFVTLKRSARLRGCIGTILPACDDLASEIVRNAIQAATGDPRFAPVTSDELPEIAYSVDVLSAPEPVAGSADLDPKRYGCIVRGPSGRLGLLLPDLEGVDTVQQQLDICRQKGGIGPSDPVDLERFTVTRYGDH